MRSVILVTTLFFLSIFYGCEIKNHNNNLKNVLSKKDSIIEKVDSLPIKNTPAFLYDSLYFSIECDDKESEIDSKQLEQRIDSLLSSLLAELRKSKIDTTIVNPLIEVLEFQQNKYKAEAASSADLIFWSYGVASMTGERVVARKCYYLKELQRKFSLISAASEKIHGTVINL